MNPKLAHLLVRMYPRPWRERYAAELEALLRTERGGLRASANVVWAAIHERVFPTPGFKVNQYPTSVVALTKKPSAFLPLAMSFTALAVLGIAATMGDLVRQPDEGVTAHIWQILMGGQIPVLIFFAVKWVRRAPKQTLYVLAFQAAAVISAMAPVYFLHL